MKARLPSPPAEFSPEDWARVRTKAQSLVAWMGRNNIPSGAATVSVGRWEDGWMGLTVNTQRRYRTKIPGTFEGIRVRVESRPKVIAVALTPVMA